MLQALATCVLAVGARLRRAHARACSPRLILLSAAGRALGQPSYAAMQPDLVAPEELMAMVSLVAYSWNSGRVIGPLLGTVLVLAVGPAWTVAFNAITFLVLACAVSWCVGRSAPQATDESVLRTPSKDGWRALWATPGCAHGDGAHRAVTSPSSRSWG